MRGAERRQKDMNTMIECAGWKQNSCDDGPGVRSVLFLQGCEKHCPGCHNPDLQEHGKGITVSVDEVAAFVLERCRNRKLTISGGEPLEQLEALLELSRKLKAVGFHICVYTGRNWEKIPESLLDLVDIMKVGGFLETRKNPALRYVGSSNQRMLEKDHNGAWKAVLLAIS